MSVELLPGFSNLKDVVNNRVIGDLIPEVTEAYDRTLEEHNTVTNQMLDLFCTPTTLHKVKYKSPVAARLMGLDEHGRARKAKGAGSYDLGFPIYQAGLAIGDTRIAMIKNTVKDVNDKLAMLLDADKRWLRDMIFAALLDNAGYTFGDDEYGDIAVKAIANGDSQEYLIRAGSEAGETGVNHFRAQAATLADASNPFPTIYRDLTKRPENVGGNVITFIPTNLEDEATGLATFMEESDPDITLGVNTDRLTGTLNASVPGEVLGKADRNWIVRWDALPDNYTISISTGGDRPLAMRQHAEAELQGFNRVRAKDDSPYFESEFQRHAGFGAWNRVSAIITRFGNASYAVPTGLNVGDVI
jgi:hypothetical protein